MPRGVNFLNGSRVLFPWGMQNRATAWFNEVEVRGLDWSAREGNKNLFFPERLDISRL